MDLISLRCGACRALVDPQGAQIVSFTNQFGREVIWQGDPKIWSDHSPILFPVCGALKDDGVSIGGKHFAMAKHGFAMNALFQVAKLGDDFVELVLRPNEVSLSMYPFDFVLHVTYTVFQDGFTTTFLVENLSQDVMPFCLGGHPGFVCPMEEGASFEDYRLVFDQEETGEIAVVPGGGMMVGEEVLPGFRNARELPLAYDLFDRLDTLLFTRLRSRSIRLVHKDTGKGIDFSFPKFDALAVWTMPDAHAPYLCLEPWQGLPGHIQESGRFEDKAFVVQLQPGRCYKTWFTAKVDV